MKTYNYNIDLVKPCTTYYTAVAGSKKRVIELLTIELDKDNIYSTNDFEIIQVSPAIQQNGNYFNESFKNEMI